MKGRFTQWPYVLFTGLLIFITSVSLLTPHAFCATFVCDGSQFEIDAPDSWVGTVSSSKTSVQLEFADNDELTVTVIAKKTKRKISGSQIVSRFKKRWKEIKSEFPKSAIVKKPSKTTVGKYTAVEYYFRYRNFLNTVIDERLLWFNVNEDSLKLATRFEISGPAREMKAEEGNIQYIIESFRLIKKEQSPPPATETTTDSNTYTSSTGGNTSNSTWASQSSANSGTSARPNVRTIVSQPHQTASQRSNSGRSKFVAMKQSPLRQINPDGLMSTATEITDPVKLAQYKNTFQKRNIERTAEQKAAAVKYSGGFGKADLSQ